MNKKLTQKNISIGERLAAPMPPFFRRIRNFGLVLGAVATAILTSPIALPPVLITVAGYATVLASAIAAVASLTVDYDATKDYDATNP
jgi:hypothetical protein